MAGFGAPETSQVSTAVIPSVTVVSSGGCINAGLMSRIKNLKKLNGSAIREIPYLLSWTALNPLL